MLGYVAFRPCTLPSQMGAPGVEAQCGSLSVAENPAQPQGRRIALNIAWIPADQDGHLQPDPVFLLAGGPGPSATASPPALSPASKDVRQQRAQLQVAPRGTGTSNPLQTTELA